MDRKYAKLFAGAAAVALAVSSVGSAVAQDDGYVIGVTNTVQGNGWREEMICSIKAQALASGEVASLNIAHRNTDPAGQLEDLRNLIAAGVDAIIMNPADPEALNSAVKEATDAGIPVITIDATVTEPSSYILTNDQETYGYLGAKWLFEQMGGTGAFFYMRGLAGHPADDARDVGIKRAMEEFPDITIAKEVFTGWQQDEGKQQMLDMIASGIPFDGVWTSGIDTRSSCSTWARSRASRAPRSPTPAPWAVLASPWRCRSSTARSRSHRRTRPPAWSRSIPWSGRT